MSRTAPGWEGLLDDGETILWQGRPRPGLNFAPVQPMQIFMGLFFMGFSLFWMRQAAWITGSGPFGPLSKLFPLFGLPFFFIGAYNAGGYALWRGFLQGRTWYTLTDRRAFVATDVPFRGRSLKSYPITADTVLEFDGEEPATLTFAYETGSRDAGGFRYPVAFHNISDGRAVYRLMRDIQKGKQP
jgi:hypothetical protein